MGESEPFQNAAAMAPQPSAEAPSQCHPGINRNSFDGCTTSFGAGMYVTLWPKVEKCHKYVSVLLAAQEQLQETIAELLTGLREAEQMENHSLVQYADRLKSFPQRVERLQSKLELIEDRLLAIKANKKQRKPRVVVSPPSSGSGTPLGANSTGAKELETSCSDGSVGSSEPATALPPAPPPPHSGDARPSASLPQLF